MNVETSLLYFYKLKKEVQKKFHLNHPACSLDIHEWKGEDIQMFQEDLLAELNERLSERWYYMHIKPLENEKLPRIDMLNILSRYVGCANWDEFNFKHQDIVSSNEKDSKKEIPIKNRSTKKSIWLLLVFLFIVITLGLVFRDKIWKNDVYTFCFLDHDSNQPVIDSNLEVTIINKGESPIIIHATEDGCFRTKTTELSLKFVVKAPYYKVDTIERKLDKSNRSEIIKLRADDYALMIHLFSTSDIKDWSKRRKQLDDIILDEAIIFQVSKDEIGMEMYNKTEFIDKMTTPIKSLKNIEILETIYENEKIKNMRFVQKK